MQSYKLLSADLNMRWESAMQLLHIIRYVCMCACVSVHAYVSR